MIGFRAARWRVVLAASVGLVAVAGAAGCAPRLRMAMAGAYIRDLTAAAARHDDLYLVAEATPACLLMIEGLLAGDPENASLHATAAQLYLVYGSLLEQEAPDRTALAYAHAKQHGLAALAARRDVGALLDRPLAEFVRIGAKLSRRDLPAVFAAAAGWGARACTGTWKNRTSLKPVCGATPQLAVIVSLMNFASTPPRLTVVLAA